MSRFYFVLFFLFSRAHDESGILSTKELSKSGWGKGFEQPGLMEDIPAQGKGCGTKFGLFQPKMFHDFGIKCKGFASSILGM